jgi:hypothetical protein
MAICVMMAQSARSWLTMQLRPNVARKPNRERKHQRRTITLYHVGYYDPLSPDAVPRIIGRPYDGSDEDQENMRIAMEECNRILATKPNIFAVISSFPVEYELRPLVSRRRR